MERERDGHATEALLRTLDDGGRSKGHRYRPACDALRTVGVQREKGDWKSKSARDRDRQTEGRDWVEEEESVPSRIPPKNDARDSHHTASVYTRVSSVEIQNVTHLVTNRPSTGRVTHGDRKIGEKERARRRVCVRRARLFPRGHVRRGNRVRAVGERCRLPYLSPVSWTPVDTRRCAIRDVDWWADRQNGDG